MCGLKAFLRRRLRTVEMPAKSITAHTCSVTEYVCACAMCAVCMIMYIQKHRVREQIHVSIHVEARDQLQVSFLNGYSLCFEMDISIGLVFATQGKQQAPGQPVSVSPALGLQVHTVMLGFVFFRLGIKLGSLCLQSKHFPAEPSPQPSGQSNSASIL